MKLLHPLFLCLAAVFSAAAAFAAPSAAPLLRPADRIVFVGDSITGQGANGWTRLLAEALREEYPDSKYSMVSLGGSGHGVGSWINVEKRSREQSFVLDIKGVDVREELGRPADVVVCMLGMNDVLFPHVKETPEEIERWAGRYRELIRALRERTRPRVFALATPTLCTEDLASPKNRVMDALIARMNTLAAEEGCVVLPTNQTMRELLAEGRAARADFHVTSDFVHPNGAGHVAIAAGMLRGLGEDRLAEALLGKHRASLKKEPISYQLERIAPVDLATANERFRLRVFDNTGASGAASVRLTLPEGWRQLPPAEGQPASVFVIEGVPDRLSQRVRIELNGQVAHAEIPAPWLIGVARQNAAGWSPKGFDPAQRIPAADAWFSKGERFGVASEVEAGQPLEWHRHIASINYGGGATPGAIDFAAITFFQNFDLAYGVRWIYSPVERPATLQLERLGFVSGGYLVVWMNGEQIHSAALASIPKADLPVTLKAGWNALVFRSHNYQVQWQFALHLTCDGAEDLRVAASPPPQL